MVTRDVIKMATGRKTNAPVLSPEKPCKKGKPSQSESFPTLSANLVAEITSAVKESLHEIIDRQVADAIKAIKDAFQERINLVEDKCRSLEKALQYEIDSNEDAIRSLQRQVTDLKLHVEQEAEVRAVDADLIVDGVEETPDEVPKDIFLKAIEACGTKVDPRDVLQVIRLGPSPRNGADSQGHLRPRRLLVKTTSRHAKQSLMAAKVNLRKNGSKIYLSDSLTKGEQARRRQLVPLLKALRANTTIRCHLERASIVINGQRFFSPECVRHFVETKLAAFGAPDSARRNLLAAFDAAHHPSPRLGSPSTSRTGSQ